MSYSRRQLYALGEPLGNSVTRKAGGKIIYGDGGGSSQPSTTTQTTDLPDWAKGYAKDTLAKGAALTDISQNPYQAYGGQRIAGFTPLQEQTFQTAAGMQPSSQLGLGTGLAGAAGLGALGTNYQAGRFSGGQFGNQQAAQYMSPYVEQAMQPQLREAQRASDIMGQQQRAQAVGAGAFGGSRQAIMEAERERNLGMQQSDIRAKGYQTAYEQAANQYNQDMARRLQAQQLGEQSRQYGAGLGMQGLQTALQSAGQLGQLGQTEYGQKMGITSLQSQLGSQQQQQAQRPLDVAYQDFLNQQNYPYKQLGFMSDLVRGLPLGQKSTSQVYEGSGPGLVQTLAGLGGAAYGFGKSGLFAAEGGLMESYADGGVTSPRNIENILSKLSDQQLAQAKEAALNRRDVQEAEMIDAEMAERASIRGGLGGAFNQIPAEQQEAMMAGGGIVAFAKGGDTYGNRFEQSLSDLQAMSQQQPPVQTAEQYEQGVMSRQPMVERLMGEDVTKPYLEETKSKRAALADQMEKDKGLAIAMASLKLLSTPKEMRGRSQTEQLVSGLGQAGEAFIGEVGRLKKEHREVDDKLRQSEILLATAQQARKEGNAKLAMGLEDKAQAQAQEAYKTRIGIQEKVAQLQSGMAQTELQGKNAKEVAAMHAAVQREAFNKPGELERIMGEVEAIRSGKKSFAGKTGEEGAQAYKETLSQVGEARGGYRYLGPEKSVEHAAAIRKQALDDTRVKDAGLAIIAAGSDPAKKQAAQENYNRILQTVEQELRQQAELDRTQRASAGASGTTAPPSKSVSAVGSVPPLAAINLLKSDPSKANRIYFDQTFGPGSASKVLGQ